MIGEQACPRLVEHARLSKDRFTGDSVLLAPETAVTLNPTAAAILALCDGERTMSEITRQLAERFQAPESMLRPDVEQFLERLEGRGYLVLEPRG